MDEAAHAHAAQAPPVPDLAPEPVAAPGGGNALPALSPPVVLALQRTAGNARVTRMLAGGDGDGTLDLGRRVLARYDVEGPGNIHDPVHEVLTLRAIAEALDRVKARGAKPG